MLKAKSLVTTLLLALPTLLSAQNELDAFRTLNPSSVGTARSLGMAGAFSSVGADFSATSLNPAGLALYRKSEFMFTPSLRTVSNNSSFLDESGKSSYGKFGFTNAGYVYADKIYRWNPETRYREEASSGFRSYAFSVGFNQTAHYGRNTKVSAFNPSSSMTEYFASLANGTPAGSLEQEDSYASQAWWAYMIDTSGVDGNYIGAAEGGKVQQEVEMAEIGRNNEWTVGFAANFEDKVYFGASLGIQNINYQQEMIITEEDIFNQHNSWANDSTPFTSGTFTTGFQTKGTGFNLRAGLIARVTDYLRIGASVVTPTALSSNDYYYSEVVGYLDGDNQPKQSNASEGNYTYSFVQPFKATLGAMYQIGKRGFLSADLDYVDYTAAKFKSNVPTSSSFYYSFRDENASIRDIFSSAFNFRLGGELRFGPGRARAGFGQYGSILKKDYLSYFNYGDNTVQKLRDGKQVYSLGLGLKQKSFYLDLAFVHEQTADRRLVYTLPDASAYSPELINKVNSNNIYMTIGFTF